MTSERARLIEWRTATAIADNVTQFSSAPLPSAANLARCIEGIGDANRFIRFDAILVAPRHFRTSPRSLMQRADYLAADGSADENCVDATGWLPSQSATRSLSSRLMSCA